MRQTRFASVEDVIARLDPSYPVFCLWPALIEAKAREFLTGFPGKVLYAVKCNPHPIVLRALHRAGLRDFDTASLYEIAQVSELFDDVTCYFNHPVKGRGALESADNVYGIRDYVIDHVTELDKLVEMVGTDITVAVRFATPKANSMFNLSAKFGATPDDAVSLLREVEERGCRAALAFHVGSQCSDPHAYSIALELAASIGSRAGVEIEYLDVGGGFPARYESGLPPLSDYFDVIRTECARLELTMPLLCEPGRALVGDAGSLLTQVHMRRGQDLYLNDGIYGCLSEVRDSDLIPAMRAIGRRHNLSGAPANFRIFGPTCDPIDVLKVPFVLPTDIEEGDWIEIERLGAYSLALSSGFNGFVTDAVVEIDGLPNFQ